MTDRYYYTYGLTDPSRSKSRSPESPTFNTTFEDHSQPQNGNPSQKEVQPKSTNESRRTDVESNNRFSNESQSRPSNMTAVTLHINLGPMGTRELRCNLEDNPQELAFTFVNEHSLAQEAIPVIVNVINKQLKKLNEKQIKARKTRGQFTLGRDDKNIWFENGNNNTSNVNEPKQHQQIQQPQEQQPQKQQMAESQPKVSKWVQRSQEKPKHVTKNQSIQQQGDDPNISLRGEGQESTAFQKEDSIYTNKTDLNKLIAKLDLNIGPNQKKTIHFYRGQVPYEVARDFCNAHGLNQAAMKPIANTLNSYLQQYLASKELKEKKKKSSQPSSLTDQKIKETESSIKGTIYDESAIQPPKDKPKNQNNTNPDKKGEEQQLTEVIQQTQQMFKSDNEQPKPKEQPINKNQEQSWSFKIAPPQGKITIKRGAPELEIKRQETGNFGNQVEQEDQEEAVKTNHLQQNFELAHDGTSTQETRDQHSKTTQAQDSPEKYDENNGGGSDNQADLSQRYERWQNLIKEKEKIAQIDETSRSPQQKKHNFAPRSLSPVSEQKIASKPAGNQFFQFQAAPPKLKKEFSFNPGSSQNQNLYNYAMQSLAPKNSNADSEKSSQSLHQSFQQNNNIQSPPNSVRTSGMRDSDIRRKMLPEDAKKLGQRLHDSWKSKQEKIEAKRSQQADLLERQEEDEVNKLTFQPRVSGVNPWHTRHLKGSQTPTRRYMNMEEQKKIKEKHEQMRLEIQMEECPFHPLLSDRTLIMTEQRSRSRSPIHQTLYKEGMEHEKHMAKWRNMAFEEQYKFKPQLNEDNYKFLKGRSKMNQQEHIRKLQQEAKDIEQKNIEKRLIEQNGIDKKTGQKLHQPVINHDKYYWNLKKKDDEHFGIALDLSTMKAVKKKMQTPKNSAQNTSQDQSVINTQKAVSNPALIKIIFDNLDSDKDGKISPANMDIVDLDFRIMEVITPFFEWFEKDNSEIDFEKFCFAIADLNLDERIEQVFSKIKLEENNSNTFISAGADNEPMNTTAQTPSKIGFHFPQSVRVNQFATVKSVRGESSTSPYSQSAKSPMNKKSQSKSPMNRSGKSPNRIGGLPKHYKKLVDKQKSHKNIPAMNETDKVPMGDDFSYFKPSQFDGAQTERAPANKQNLLY